MAGLVRMGARASLEPQRQPISRSAAIVLAVDEKGDEVELEVPHEVDLTLDVAHFVDLDDGRRITTERFGGMTLTTRGGGTVAGLHADLREMIFEDELRETDEELAAEPRWELMTTALTECGVPADDAALAALPFIIELDDDVVAELGG